MGNVPENFSSDENTQAYKPPKRGLISKKLEEIHKRNKEEKAKVHEELSAEDQEFVRHIVIRHVGCDIEGNTLRGEVLEEDLLVLLEMEKKLVVKPDEIARQVEKFVQALSEVGGDYIRLDPAEFRFMNMGGHVSENSFETLQDMLSKRDGYAILAEYFDGTERFPLAYNYGFTKMPASGSKYPNLDARKIRGAGDTFVKTADKIWTIWRAGVLEELDDDIVEKYKAHNIQVPPKFKGKKLRRLGINNAFKPPIATAAEGMGRELISYNTAMLMREGEVLDAAQPAMRNQAILGANEGVFMQLSGVGRDYVDVLKQNGGRSTIVRWAVYGNRPDLVLNAEEQEGSVLRAKGGWDIERLKNMGTVLKNILQTRQKAESALKKGADPSKKKSGR